METLLSKTVLKSKQVCFYCKMPIGNSLGESNRCNHDCCDSAIKRKSTIEVEYYKIRLTPWWNIFKPRFRYVAKNYKYQFVMKYLANKNDEWNIYK